MRDITLSLFFAALVSSASINFSGGDDPCSQCASDCSLYSTLNPIACGKSCAEKGACPEGYVSQFSTGKSNVKESPHREDPIVQEAECSNGYTSRIKLDKKSTKRGSRPNIVLILLDDQDYMTSPFLESMPFVKDYIFDNGVKFDRTLSPSSVGCGARCQILTGLFGHNVGVTTNTGKYGGYDAFTKPLDQSGKRMQDENGKCINNEDRTVPLYLKESGGYATAIIGKYVNDYGGESTTHVSPGWTKFTVNPDKNLYLGYNYTLMSSGDDEPSIKYNHYGFGEEDYATDVIRDEAVDFIRSQRSGSQRSGSDRKPLFMYVSATAPHLPLTPAPRHQEHIKYWESRFDEVVGVNSRRSNYFEEDIGSKPEWLRMSGEKRMNMKDSDFLRADFAKRMTSLMAVDEMVAKMVNTLRETGDEDNTIWMVTSDNGYNLGAHRLIHKMAPYEESVRIPLAIRGLPGQRRGTVISDQVALPDLAPTFIDLAGMQMPAYMDGRSLAPFLGSGYRHTKKTVPFPKRDVLLQYGSHGGGETIPPEYLGIYQEIPGFVLSSFTGSGLFTDVPPYLAMRTYDDRLFVKWYGVNNDTSKQFFDFNSKLHQYELYHMNDDPYQLKNLAKLPEYQTEVEEMKARLDKLWRCKGETC